MRYNWLLFDADGTLFDYDGAESYALETTLQHFGVPFCPTVLSAYQQINQQLWRDFEDGKVTAKVLRLKRFELFFERIGLSLNPQEFSDLYLEHLGGASDLLPGVIEVLLTLKPYFHFAILTNGLKTVQHSRLARSAIREMIEVLVISEEVGAVKPHPGFFDAAFQQMGCPPRSTALMIGDNLKTDIQGAINSGVDSCWYNPGNLTHPPALAVTYEIKDLAGLIPICLNQ
jgi:2-haloacid dehalogenase